MTTLQPRPLELFAALGLAVWGLGFGIEVAADRQKGVSGIPLLEARAEERWGSDPDYRAYRDRTPPLVLRPPRSAWS